MILTQLVFSWGRTFGTFRFCRRVRYLVTDSSFDYRIAGRRVRRPGVRRHLEDAAWLLDRTGSRLPAGPAVTALLIVGGVWILAKRKVPDAVAAFLAGLALMAGVRSFTGVYYVLFVRPKVPGARPFFDEINVARALDIPVDWIAWPSAALVVVAWIVVVPKLMPDGWLKLPAVVFGPVRGILL